MYRSIDVKVYCTGRFTMYETLLKCIVLDLVTDLYVFKVHAIC
jgi:hypothetical protein